jgi:hypothetical protein
MRRGVIARVENGVDTRLFLRLHLKFTLSVLSNGNFTCYLRFYIHKPYTHMVTIRCNVRLTAMHV